MNRDGNPEEPTPGAEPAPPLPSDVGLDDVAFGALCKQSFLPIAVTDRDGCGIWGNQAWLDLWGLDAESIAGRPQFDDPQLKRQGVADCLEQVRAGTPQTLPEVEYIVPSGPRAGRRQWVRAFCYPLWDSAGAVRRLVCIFEDVTERKEREDAERRYRRQLEELLAVGGDPRLQSGVLSDHYSLLHDAAIRIFEVDHVCFRLSRSRPDQFECWCPELAERCLLRGKARPLTTRSIPTVVAELKAGRTVVVRDVAGHPELGSWLQTGFIPAATRSIVLAPMRRADRLMGFVGVFSSQQDRTWALPEQGLLAALAELAVLSLESYERKQALQRATEHEERYTLASQAARIGVWEMDFARESLSADASLYSLVGYGRGELGVDLGDWLDRIPGRNRSEVDRLVRDLRENARDNFSMEFPFVCRDGVERWFRAGGKRVPDQEAHERRYIGTLIDVSQRRLAEDRYRTIFRNMPGAVFIVNPETDRVSDVNPQAEELMQISCARLKTMTLGDLHPADQHGYVHDIFHSPERVEQPEEREIDILRPDGSRLPVAVSTVSICDGEDRRIVGFYRDLSEQKRAEADREALESQIRHAQKLESLGVLAGGIAHDFNNLLVGILGHVELALIDQGEGQSVQEHLEEIRRAAMRASDLTNQMLAYSGKGQFIIERVQLNHLVKELGDLLQVSLSRNATLRYELDDELPLLEADASQIRQVVMNLITNASDALDDQPGTIVLCTSLCHLSREELERGAFPETLPEGAYLCLDVSDTGCGMTAETQEHLFDPFFTTKRTGRGLGMAAVQGIIRAHRGTIKVYSEVGKGTTFRVLLPAAAPVSAPAPVESVEAGARTPSIGHGLVMVADDDAGVRTVARRMLEHNGFDVIEARDGTETVEQAKRFAGELRLVVLDMTMPGPDCLDNINRLREVEPPPAVLLASGFHEQQAVKQLPSDVPILFIQKPYSFERFLRSVQTALAEETHPHVG